MSRSLSVEDRLQIEDLLSAYALTLDVDDTDGTVALFTPDCEVRAFGRTFAGHEGLRTMLAVADKGLHLAGRAVITPTDFGAAVRQQLAFFPADHSEHRLAVYDDELVRTDAGWRFRVRDIRFLDRAGRLGARP